MKHFVFALIALLWPMGDAKAHWQPVAFKSVTLDTDGNLIVKGVKAGAWEFRLAPSTYNNRPDWWHIRLEGRRLAGNRRRAVARPFKVKLNLVQANCKGKLGIVVLGGYNVGNVHVTQRMQISLLELKQNLVPPPPLHRRIPPRLPRPAIDNQYKHIKERIREFYNSNGGKPRDLGRVKPPPHLLRERHRHHGKAGHARKVR